MASLLLAVIYIAFISLGLPDSLLGSAWPIMHAELNVPASFAGIVSMTIMGCTVVSSLLSDRMTLKFGTGRLTAVSVCLTAIGLFGFSFSSSFIVLLLWAIPYGLGAGAIDAALNNYIALHYSSRHMSWLHCFWGVGAAVSPYIMSYALTGGTGWENGYRYVGYIQIGVTALLFLSLPMWKKRTAAVENGSEVKAKSLRQVLSIRSVPIILLAFFCYCAMESTTGLWATTYLVNDRGIDPYTAAKFASFFFIGITTGRFLCGFVADKLGDSALTRIGTAVVIIGILFILVPLNVYWLPLAGLIIIGFGCAPIYPSIIHSTPRNFGAENSQAIIGVQMASAYMGSTIIPPIFGYLMEKLGMGIYPVFLLFFTLLMLAMTEIINKRVAKGNT